MDSKPILSHRPRLRRVLRAAYRLAPLPIRAKEAIKHRAFSVTPVTAPDPVPDNVVAPTQPAWLADLFSASRFDWRDTQAEPICTQPLARQDVPVRTLAFYLPQYHPIPENDAWWGKNFTEWQNVTRAVPQFEGHYQPRLPADLGFYDLRLVENMRKQADLAAHYGLAGFCLYYYWFGGKRLLTLPQQHILDNPDLDMPFCLCWANENWTRRWDGLESDVLMAQQYSPDDDLAMIADLANSFRDSRYIRIDGKPVFLVYRPLQLPDPKATVDRWRAYCRQHGIGELYLVAVESLEVLDPQAYGFDANTEFPPHQSGVMPINGQIRPINPDYQGSVHDYRQMAANFMQRPSSPYRRFRAVTPSWDNEARKPGRGHTFIHAQPAAYETWFRAACAATMREQPATERLVFINAWNEWAEGAYLEPDKRHGYAYLNATGRVLRDLATDAAAFLVSADTAAAAAVASLPASVDAAQPSPSPAPVAAEWSEPGGGQVTSGRMARFLGLARAIYLAMPLPGKIKAWMRDLFFKVLVLASRYLRKAEAHEAPGATGLVHEALDFTHAFISRLYAAGKFSWGRHDYVHYCDKALDAGQLDLRAIAFYLPQFHPIPENDAWWGKGFTEWSNVTRAMPQFVGHYQPKLPGDMGFYDLRLLDNMRKQADLAAHYGLAGFCLYYYWFGGKRLLDMPQQQILANPDLEMPFCLCWANENWTRRWDGQESDVLMAQRYSPEDDLAMMADLVPSFRDRRYIRVDGKAVFLVYCPMLLPDPKATVARWRDYCREQGVGELYLIAVESFNLLDPADYGFDATCEFPPHQAALMPINHECAILNEDFEGRIYDYRDMARLFTSRPEPSFVRHSGIATAWDNNARKPGKGNVFIQATPGNYADWLRTICRRTVNHVPPAERMVFINAWNEWAEGAYLEPDKRYGYAYLHATANVLREFARGDEVAMTRFAAARNAFSRRADTALVVHLFYTELLDDLVDMINALPFAVDVFMSVAQDIDEATASRILTLLPNVYVMSVPNRGRDVLPFYSLLPLIQQWGYTAACKVHTKKSPHMPNGVQWRKQLWQDLLAPETAEVARRALLDDASLGLLAPEGSLTNLAEPDIHVDNQVWLDRLISQFDSRHVPGQYPVWFPAGSMFWFRPAAMPTLLTMGLTDEAFETELGQLDGTLAHALERLFAWLTKANGYRFDELKRQ
jgi:lipopolysaccharide biosynthesis protein